MIPGLVKLSEPTLLFRHEQAMEDPKDGLMLFGPLDEGKPYGIRAGVIGTKDGICRFRRWLERIQKPVFDEPRHPARPPFPGFEAVFRIPWNPQPTLEIEVPETDLSGTLRLDDSHQRVYKTVDVYSSRIIAAIQQEETQIDVWFVVIPDDVHKYCRPLSRVEPGLQMEAASKMSLKHARLLKVQPSLFTEDNIAAIPYHYDVDFHNQLKARLLSFGAPTQVIREGTVAHRDFRDSFGRPKRDLDALQSDIAWSISTAAFYKAGGRPWKIGHIREGVCYIGLVFKRDERGTNPQSACCAAQMFLDSGDGIVFKGAIGPWYTPSRGDFHLSRDAARDLVSLAVTSYKQKKGEPPKELFLHGKVRFNQEEWRGFEDAVQLPTNLVGVRIRHDNDIKVYRTGKHPVLRGLAYIRDERTAYLWTKGFIPRLQTYPGREVPNPLLIDVCRGRADIEVVLNDIMALTKLNYNACVFADGSPVTLKFADAVGEILTAGPVERVPPLPFKHYI
jgi:hypothetical protein